MSHISCTILQLHMPLSCSRSLYQSSSLVLLFSVAGKGLVSGCGGSVLFGLGLRKCVHNFEDDECT